MSEAASSDPSAGGSGALRIPVDDRLFERATKGDRQAFAAIYRRYHQDLYRFCLAIVGNRQDAQDALQNTMVKAMRALPGEERRIQLKPWLFKVARNEAIELLRRRREGVELQPELIAASGGEPDETAALRERLRRLFADLAALPERQRTALAMRELAGLGFAEIGVAFDTSDAVARQTVYEARLSLRQMEAGREMSCKKVMWELSEADGRMTRRREIQAHLRNCAECRAFRDEITKRRQDLAAIAPLPLAVSASLLQGLLAGDAAAAGTGAAGSGAAGAAGLSGTTGAGAGATAGGGAGAAVGTGGALAGAVAAGAGKVVATSAFLKAAATVAVVAAGVTAADRSGLVETPLPPSIGGAKSSDPAPASERAGESQSQPDRPTAGAPSGAVDPGRNPGLKPAGPNGGPKRRGDAVDGPSKAVRRKYGSSAASKGANGQSQAKGQGRPDGPPGATKHEKQTAAGAGTQSKSKNATGNGTRSKGGGKSKGSAKSRPPRDSNVSPKTHGAPAKSHTPAEVGADKAAGAPFQPAQSPTGKSASPEGSADPSKEAR